MEKMVTVSFLVVLLLIVTTANGQCPDGCFCLAGYVTCSGLKSIPSVFPDDTRSVSINKINADEIPAGIFDKLPVLESIEIYSGTIGKISSGAFGSLSSLELISLNELTIGTIEPYAFSYIQDVGTISLYMSTIGTIEPYAFTEIFALDEIKLFMLEVTNIDSFALNNIDELHHFRFYTNDIESMQPYAFSNFSNAHELSMYLNNIGYLGCGSVEALLDATYTHSFYSNKVNCSCDLTWISRDLSLKKYLYSNWCQVPDTDEKILWEDVSLDTLQCSSQDNSGCPSAASLETLFANIAITYLLSSREASSLTIEPVSTETSSVVFKETLKPNKPTSTAASKTSLPPPDATETKLEVTKEIFLPRGPSLTGSGEIKTIREFHQSSEATTEASTSTSIGVKLDSTKYVKYPTKPRVVISEKTEEVKAVDGSKSVTNIEEPQNVSIKLKGNDVNGSKENRLCAVLIVLTLIIAVI